ncbi:hypothetical protein STEG23_023744 [Scotinomys teguina]
MEGFIMLNPSFDFVAVGIYHEGERSSVNINSFILSRTFCSGNAVLRVGLGVRCHRQCRRVIFSSRMLTDPPIVFIYIERMYSSTFLEGRFSERLDHFH